MKKTVLLFFLLGTFAVMGQTPKERIKALKTSFITRELDLGAKEAAEFWPIYFEYDEALENTRRKQSRKILEDYKNIDTMTDEKARAVVKEYLKAEAALLKAQQDLIDNLAGVLPDVKILRLLRAEKAFNQRMLQRLKNRN